MKLKTLGLVAMLSTACAPAETSSNSDTKPSYEFARSIIPSVIERNPNILLEAPLEKALEATDKAVRPDVYIIDFSGSMDHPALGSQKSKLDVAKNHKYGQGSKVYACAADIHRYKDGSPMDSVWSAGGTPIYRCLGDILLGDTTKYENILILTDGEDTEGGYTKKQLVDLAKAKNTCLTFLMIGDLDKKYVELMDHLNKQTCSDSTKRNLRVNN